MVDLGPWSSDRTWSWAWPYRRMESGGGHADLEGYDWGGSRGGGGRVSGGRGEEGGRKGGGQNGVVRFWGAGEYWQRIQQPDFHQAP